MRKVRNTNLRFKKPAEFSIEKHLSGSFGVFKGRGGRFKVRIQFDAFAAQLVAERQWHATQKLQPIKDGGLELRMELGNLEEVERWVLSWGAHARVLEPKELVERIRDAVTAVGRLY
jgi:predicted DNA-binding transcriptional regulator YafY